MYKSKHILYLFALFLFFSCNNDGTVIHNITEEEDHIVNNLIGNGCSNSTLCYPLSAVNYNFSSDNAIEQTFYKFDREWSEGGVHYNEENATEDNPADLFTLKSWNNEYVLAVPSSIVQSTNQEDSVLMYELSDGEYSFQSLGNIDSLPNYLTEVETQPAINRIKSSILSLQSNTFSNIKDELFTKG